MANIHVSVLKDEVIELFRSAPEGTIVDGTFGGGGHTLAFLEVLGLSRVLALDVDPMARGRGSPLLSKFETEGRFFFLNCPFQNLPNLAESEVPRLFRPPWAGAFLDLGYSSNQLEDAEYGLSFQKDGPLDMRLSRSGGQTAWELLCDSNADELGEILRVYGEIRGARGLSERIRNAITSQELSNSTASLARFLEKAIGRRDRRDAIHPATQVFQALRIAVNDELRSLDQFLEGAILKMMPRAVLAFLTFHSLEDRIVKQWSQRHSGRIEPIYRKPLVASEEETRHNPRARSAKLRAYRIKER